MFGRDWLHNAAIRGILIALFVFGASGLYAQENNTEQQSEAPQAETAQQEPAEPAPPSPPDRIEAVETNWSKPECAEAKSHDESSYPGIRWPRPNA